MKHKHYEVLIQWLADQTIELEYLSTITNEWMNNVHPLRSPLTHPHLEWRIKPKMVKVGRHEWPEPLSVAPEKGTLYWAAAPNQVTASCWASDEFHFIRLSSAVIHLTEEAAQQHADALVCINRGDV